MHRTKPTDPLSAAPDFEGVIALLQDYFEGLYEGDTARLARVFHPQARYNCATDGQLVHLDMAEYFPLVERRPSPRSRQHARTDRILSIEFAGPVTALAKVECSIPGKCFLDLLTMVRVDGRWQIIGKVFHHHAPR
jgi:4-oxalocrotonate tautomerase